MGVWSFNTGEAKVAYGCRDDDDDDDYGADEKFEYDDDDDDELTLLEWRWLIRTPIHIDRMKEENVKIAKMFQLFALNGDLGR